MDYSKADSWVRFQNYYSVFPGLGLTLDLSRARTTDFFDSISPRMENAFREIDALKKGAIANWDESRMVGQYWLRNNSAGAPHPKIGKGLDNTFRIDNTLSYLSSQLAQVPSVAGGRPALKKPGMECSNPKQSNDNLAYNSAHRVRSLPGQTPFDVTYQAI